MSSNPECRLYERAELAEVLNLSPQKIDWLISTGQLCPIRICGQFRFDSRDIDQLIQTYKQIARRKSYVQ